MRYFLIDRVTELRPGQSATGIKNVTLSEQVLHDHFPDHPVFPGALLLEAASQLAGFLLEMTLNTEGRPVQRAMLAQVEKAKFYQACRPGDQIMITVHLDSVVDKAAQIRAEARVAGDRVAVARLTFVMQEIESDRVHAQRTYLYRLWTRDLTDPIKIV